MDNLITAKVVSLFLSPGERNKGKILEVLSDNCRCSEIQSSETSDAISDSRLQPCLDDSI